MAEPVASPAQSRPTREGARQYTEFVRIRKTYTKLQEVFEKAEAEGIDILTKLTNLGFRRIEDFYLTCPKFALTESSENFSELGVGYVCFFDLLKFVGMLLLLFLCANTILMGAVYAPTQDVLDQAENSWLNLYAPECRTCLREADGNAVPSNASQLIQSISPPYGLGGCLVYDWSPSVPDSCQQNYGSGPFISCVGLWCCNPWCYVSMQCPRSLWERFSVSSSLLAEDRYLVRYGCAVSAPDSTCVNQYQSGQCDSFEYAAGNKQYTKILDPSWRTPSTVGWHLLESWIPIAVFGGLFFIALISMTVYQGRQKEINHKVDAATIFPNDYAILVRGLPIEGADEAKIKKFFEENACGSGSVEVVKVVIGWDMKQFNMFKKDRNAIVKKIVGLQKTGCDALHPEILELRRQIGQISAKLLSVTQQDTIMLGSGAAVVVFRYQSDHREALLKWDSFAVRMLTFFGIPHMLPLYDSTHVLHVIRAPNPTEILWENLAVPRILRWKRWATTWLTMVCILIAAAMCHLYIERWRRDIRNLELDCDETCDNEGATAQWVGSLIPLLTALINVILMIAARILSAKEFHDTLVSKESALIWKLSSVLVFNTVFMQIIVRNDPKEWYLTSGLVFDILLLLIFNSILSPLLVLVDIGFMIKRRLGRRINLEKTKLPAKVFYHKYHEPSELNLPMQYAIMVKMFSLAVFYMPMLPWAPGIAMTGIFLQYWANKYMLVRKFKRPEVTRGIQGAQAALKVVSVTTLFALPLGHYIFLKAAYKQSGSRVLLIMFSVFIVIAVLVQFLPYFMRRRICCCALFFRRADPSQTAQDADYYAAQHLWEDTKRYHKVQPLYRHLPEKLNPTLIVNSDAPTPTDQEQYSASIEIATNEEEDLDSRNLQFLSNSFYRSHVNLPRVALPNGTMAIVAQPYRTDPSPMQNIEPEPAQTPEPAASQIKTDRQPQYVTQNQANAVHERTGHRSKPSQRRASSEACSEGCGRPPRPGNSRSGQKYQTCCRSCALTHGTKHDTNCQH